MKPNRSILFSEYYDTLFCPIGTLYLIFNSLCLIGISFEKPSTLILKQTGISASAKKELDEYFSKGRMVFGLNTCFIEGTSFERKVWETLKQIPYGQTRTYKWLAEIIDRPNSSRAVGNALGKNPIPVIFPCHRIIESDGSIGGYTPGTDIKRRLLEIEYYTMLSGRKG